MPRKKKSKKNDAPKPTYHKSKNGRYYKKTTVNGKCQCRFVSKAEGEAGFSGSSAAPKKSAKKKKENVEEEELP